MKVITSALEAMAVDPAQYPKEELPEIAFAGRSNVGKSTLINTFCQRKKLAYTSSTPGKTRTVNFYGVEAEWADTRHRFRLVDLPGYGYAKVARHAQDDWAKSINTYLEERKGLLEVILLCDLRHAPTAQDVQMMQWIRAQGYRGLVIATKADKLPTTKVLAQRNAMAKGLAVSKEDVYPYAGSVATKSFGIEAIRTLFCTLLS